MFVNTLPDDESLPHVSELVKADSAGQSGESRVKEKASSQKGGSTAERDAHSISVKKSISSKGAALFQYAKRASEERKRPTVRICAGEDLMEYSDPWVGGGDAAYPPTCF